MPNILYLFESDKPNKKYMVYFINPKTGRPKKVYFGAIKPNGKPYEDFTTHKDPERKMRYLKRHAKEDWNDLTKAGAWSRYILWNKPTLDASIKDMNKRFDIKIIPISLREI
jgi:hypothetical protein